MLIYRQVQHRGARRATLHAAGWISFALIVMSVAPSLSRATLVCSGTPEFVQQCEAAIEEVRATTPVGEAIVEELTKEGPGSHLHVILEDPTPDSRNIPLDRAAANDLESGGLGIGSDTTTFWNPTATDPFISEPSVDRDPIATMQHELAHAWVADTGGRSEETVPGTDVGRREVDATIIEDEYREAVGLDLRTRYDGAAVPTPTPIPETGSSILSS